MKKSAYIFSIFILFPAFSLRAGLNGEILERSVDGNGNGYTVMRVWGSYYEMGYAQGYLMATQIEDLVQGVKDYIDDIPLVDYNKIKNSIVSTWFMPTDAETEIDGIVAGVLSADPSSSVDAGDIKVINTIGDWLYAPYCRSHSCWGSFVEAPTVTLSSRRLDFPDLPAPYMEHLLCARIPSDSGKVRWVNLSFPGYVTVITGVNEYGTVVSLHDYRTGSSHAEGDDVITRNAAARFALTMDLPEDTAEQLDHVYYRLQPYIPYVGSFINYYIPNGYGGVFTCSPSSGFYKKRTPQTDYFGGEVLITTNSETDGHSTPSGGEFLEDYYQAGSPKHIGDHWSVLSDHSGINGFQQLSVALRGREDMTIWFDGRLLIDEEHQWIPRVEVEWSELYRGFEEYRPVPDSGDYDGDGTSDIALFRDSSGLWAIRGVTRFYFGSSGDETVPGDYDGDGTTDAGVFRGTSGLWAVKNVTRVYFGSFPDLPIPGDYDGDNSCDAGIFRPCSGLWAIRGVSRTYFGAPGDRAVPGYYDGSGKDIAIFRPESGLWAIRSVSRIYFGLSSDETVAGDYDGDGSWDASIFRPDSGLWAIRGVTRSYFGGSSDHPVPADYDGDTADDIGIFRSASGLWAIRGLSRVYYGSSGDIPVTR